ncbi:MAG: HNH endonuclease, partial [Novosphingobium sp.]|nr:HNH endonuclease [Novosphingobium sp.]
MNKRNQHSDNHAKAYARLLKRLGAPESLIADFQELLSIDNSLSEAGRGYVDPIEDHFFHTCLSHNFSKPYDKGENKAHFRPALNHSDPNADGDLGWGAGLEGRLNEEQAYRRGFHHGFADARRRIESGKKSDLPGRELEISRWRFARIWYSATMPRQIEEWQISLRPSRTVTPKLRYEILHRYGFRCVLCGDDAESGARLEVDHIIPVSKGGSDERSNLRTLCWACNSGKGDKN